MGQAPALLVLGEGGGGSALAAATADFSGPALNGIFGLDVYIFI